MNKKVNFKLNVVQLLAIGFLALIFIGGTILCLPVSSADGSFTNYLDSIFTAVSAVSLTGLVTVDTGTHWSTFGKVIIIIMIQIGGLAFMSVSTYIVMRLGKKISSKGNIPTAESINAYSIKGLIRMVKYVVSFTFIVELLGAVILSTQLIPEYGVGRGILYSLFHSISAFCNAGFDLFGDFQSLIGHSSNTILLLTLSALVIIGGIGFIVVFEIYRILTKEIKRISLNSKVVLTVTAVLLIVGTLVMFLLEYNNPDTIGTMSIKNKILNSFFSATTPRTGGFHSISADAMTSGGKLLTIILMFIGGSSGSTAGGIKTATFGIIIIAVISVIRRREDAGVYGRKISKETVYKAFALFIIALTLISAITMILTVTESKEKFVDLFFEATSALSSAGISTGVTQRLSTVGKVIIALSMYIGRLVPLLAAFSLSAYKKAKGFNYPEGKILIG